MFQRLSQYINRITSVYFTTKHGNYTAKKVALLREFYELTNNYLKTQKTDYWLAYGTLLGYHRENGIISHDIDLDFGAPGEAFEAIWTNRSALPKGLKLYNTSHKHRGPKLFFSYKGFDADVYFYEKKGHLMDPFLISSIPADMAAFPQEWIYPLQKVEFLGELTYVPSNPKAYLEHCYGYIGRGAAFDKKTGYWYKKG